MLSGDYRVFLTDDRQTKCLGSDSQKHTVVSRQSVLVVIVRELCDPWIKMNSVALVTVEQNALSLCPPERHMHTCFTNMRSCDLQDSEPWSTSLR